MQCKIKSNRTKYAWLLHTVNVPQLTEVYMGWLSEIRRVYIMVPSICHEVSILHEACLKSVILISFGLINYSENILFPLDR